MAGRRIISSNIDKVLELVDQNKQSLAKKLCERIKFMEKTLKELESSIKKDGPVIVTKNGNGFDVTMENPAQKSYNVMIGKYNAMLKTLIDLIPKGEDSEDELLKFLGGGNR